MRRSVWRTAGPRPSKVWCGVGSLIRPPGASAYCAHGHGHGQPSCQKIAPQRMREAGACGYTPHASPQWWMAATQSGAGSVQQARCAAGGPGEQRDLSFRHRGAQGDRPPADYAPHWPQGGWLGMQAQFCWGMFQSEGAPPRARGALLATHVQSTIYSTVGLSGQSKGIQRGGAVG